MNSRTRQRERQHRIATAIAAQQACWSCGAPPPSEPAHWPSHRGMGSAKAGWEPREWIPLCRRCHDALDGRLGVSEAAQEEKRNVEMMLEMRAPLWWSLFGDQDG